MSCSFAIRRLSASVLLLVIATFARSEAAPFLRVFISPVKALVGQPVHVTVDVLVPNFFTGAPDFPQFELENAIVVFSEETPQHINLTLKGVFYAGIRRSYTVYPEQAGTFTLPSASIRAPYAAHPPETTEVTLTLPPRKFEATIPPQAQGLDYFLPTTALHLTQRWNTSFSGLKVGDTLDRTIIVTTVRMQAMFIPPIPFDAPDGIRIYPQNPAVEDQKSDRGEFLQGRRVQRATYLIQKEGEYKLPEIEIRWWDLSAGKIRTATLPAVKINAAPNPSYVAEIPPEAGPAVAAAKKPGLWHRYKSWAPAVLGIILVLVVTAWLYSRYASRLIRHWRAYRAARVNSEAATFRRLARASRANKAQDTYRLFLEWLSRSRPKKTMQDFLDESNDPSLQTELASLTTLLFSNPTVPWSGQRFLKAVKRHRHSAKTALRRDALPALNPIFPFRNSKRTFGKP